MKKKQKKHDQFLNKHILSFSEVPVKLSSKEMDTVTRAQILDEVDWHFT